MSSYVPTGPGRTVEDDEFDVAFAQKQQAFRDQERLEAEEEQRRAAAARAALDAVPDSAEPGIDADPEVAALEERVAAGDESVTDRDLAKARTAAEGRSRWARLRQLAADRKERLAAEKAEEERVRRVTDNARTALSYFTNDLLVEKYDAAARAVEDLAAFLADRNREVHRLATAPAAERVPEAGVNVLYPNTYFVPVDGAQWGHVDPKEIVDTAVGVGWAARSEFAAPPDPGPVAHGRKLLAGDGGAA